MRLNSPESARLVLEDVDAFIMSRKGTALLNSAVNGPRGKHSDGAYGLTFKATPNKNPLDQIWDTGVSSWEDY